MKAGGLNWRSAKIPNFNPKQHRFCVKKKQKRERDQATRRLVTIHHLPREHCPGSSFAGAFNASYGPQNLTTHAPKWPPEIPLSPSIIHSGLLTWKLLRWLAWSRQLGQPWTVKFGSSRCTLWTNGWDAYQSNQKPRFSTIKDKMFLFHLL